MNANDNTKKIKENEEYIKNLLDNFNLKKINFYRKEVIEKYNDYQHNKEEIDKLVKEMKNNKLRE